MCIGVGQWVTIYTILYRVYLHHDQIYQVNFLQDDFVQYILWIYFSLIPLQIHLAPFAAPNIFQDVKHAKDDAPKVRHCEVHTYSPHMYPHFNFNAEKDGRQLSEALEGSGTNEQCIIGILTTRSNAQRQEIALWYKKSLERDLIDVLNNKLSGKFCDIVIGLMTPQKEYLCKELHRSLTGLSTNEDALVEILCTKTNKEMSQLIEAYDKCQF